jgi:hypothetical protein
LVIIREAIREALDGMPGGLDGLRWFLLAGWYCDHENEHDRSDEFPHGELSPSR